MSAIWVKIITKFHIAFLHGVQETFGNPTLKLNVVTVLRVTMLIHVYFKKFQYDDSDEDDDEPSRRKRRLAAERAADGRLDVDDEDAGTLKFRLNDPSKLIYDTCKSTKLKGSEISWIFP